VRWIGLIAACSFAALLGCRGTASSSESASDASAGVSDAAVADAAAVEDAAVVDAIGARAPGCPNTVPEAGAPCTAAAPPPGHGSVGWWACEYGSDPHCTTVASCTTDYWFVTPPDPSCSGNPAGCPAAFDPTAGGTCPVHGSCTYAEGRCACGPCELFGGCALNLCGNEAGVDGGSAWQCTPWFEVAPCPVPRPLLGTPCQVDGQQCGRIDCCNFVQNDPWMVCAGGYWAPGGGGC
jgi:hypothetical protein